MADWSKRLSGLVPTQATVSQPVSIAIPRGTILTSAFVEPIGVSCNTIHVILLVVDSVGSAPSEFVQVLAEGTIYRHADASNTAISLKSLRWIGNFPLPSGKDLVLTALFYQESLTDEVVLISGSGA